MFENILQTILAILGIVLIVVLIICIIIAVLIYKFAKKKPILALFLFILLLVIGTLQVLTLEGIVTGVATYVAAILSLSLSYNRLKIGLKKLK